MENGKHWEYIAAGLAAVAIFLSVWRIGNAFDLNKNEWAAWVQAIGSIGAIVATIFVLNRQNLHAQRMFEQADRRERVRTAKSVGAIASKIIGKISSQLQCITDTENPELANFVLNCLRTKEEQDSAEVMVRTAAAIPLHELGSYNLVIGIQLLCDVTRQYDKFIRSLAANQSARAMEVTGAASWLIGELNLPKFIIEKAIQDLEL